MDWRFQPGELALQRDPPAWHRVAVLALCLLVVVSLRPTAVGAASTPVWLCKPARAPNPCKSPLKTTLVTPSGEPIRVETLRPARRPEVDCFYVYPTVSDDATPNSDLTIDPEQSSIALFQAAPYAQHCRIFAPMYRQITLAALFSGKSATAEMRQTAYSGVATAWRTYLTKYNRGRGVVLIGHSQGALMLRRLINEQIDPKPALRKRIISAVLLGSNVLVPKGRVKGADFEHIPPCTSAKQIRCLVAFSTFNAPVPPDALFGRPGQTLLGVNHAPGDPSRQRVVCVNPARPAGGQAPLRTMYPTKPFAPGTTIGATDPSPLRPAVSTPWYELDGAYTGRCVTSNNANVLQLTDAPGSKHLAAVPSAMWGLHVQDGNIALATSRVS
jgi:hypothetical protein